MVEQDASSGGVHDHRRQVGWRRRRAAPHAGHQPVPLPEAIHQRRARRPHLARHRVHAVVVQPICSATQGARLSGLDHSLAAWLVRTTGDLTHRAGRVRPHTVRGSRRAGLDVPVRGGVHPHTQHGPQPGRGLRGQGVVPDEVLRARPLAAARRRAVRAAAGLPRQRRDPALRARRGRPPRHRAQGRGGVAGHPPRPGDGRLAPEPVPPLRLVLVPRVLPDQGRHDPAAARGRSGPATDASTDESTD